MKITISGLLISVFALFMPMTICAQQHIVSGQVRDNDDNGPLIGVNVVEVDRNGRFLSGTVSDLNGNYIIRVSNPDALIQLSMLGYERQLIEVNKQTRLDIILKTESAQLDEVRIVAQRMGSDGVLAIRDRATSIARIEFNELQSSMTTTVEEMLQGRLGNVDITSVSGDPGAGLNIRIRGTATINARNNPLVVVNGIPYDTEITFDLASADIERFGNLIDVSPEDIESIEVLKDAGSTAIWGSRAANGVIMIRTKRGMKSKPRFDYAFKITRGHESRSIPMLDGPGYAQLIAESFYNKERREDFFTKEEYAWQVAYDRNLKDEYYNYAQNTNWVDEITRVAYTHQHNFSVRGGGEKSRYSLSTGYQDEQGTTIGTRMQKLNLRTSFDYDISTKLKFTSDILFTRYDQDATYDVEDDFYKDKKSLRSMAYRKMPNMTIYTRDSLNMPSDLYFTPKTNLQGNAKDLVNPVAFAREAKHKRYRDNTRAGFSLNYFVLPQLVLSSTVTLDIFDNKFQKFLPYKAVGADYADAMTNRASDRFIKKTSIQNNSRAIYTPQIGDKHDLKLMGQFDTEISYEREMITETSGSGSELFHLAVGDKSISKLESKLGEYRMMGFFLSAHYKFLDRYLFSAAMKREASSKFSPEARWGNFPALTAAWRISEEEFMKGVRFIEDLRLRASWGKSGNEPYDKYLYYNKFLSSPTYAYMSIPGIIPESVELTSLKWETIEQTNIGFSFFAHENRLNIEFDLYDKTTHDLYQKDLRIPASSGFRTINVNEGTLKNRGVEFMIDYKVIAAPNFSASFNFNISHNRNIVISLPKSFGMEFGHMEDNGQFLVSLVQGEAIGGFWGYKYLGVYSTTEDTWVRDINGNLVYEVGQNIPMQMRFANTSYNFQAGDARYADLNYDGVINTLDLEYLGDLNPKVMGGFGPRVQYKDLTLNTFFYFRLGQRIINQTRMDTEKMYDYDNQSAATYNRWRRQGDITDIPRALQGEGYNWLGSERFVEDGSFLRLKTASITYNLPKSTANSLGLSDIRVYLTGYNLYTWTRYSGQDPEVGLPSRPDKLPLDISRTPPSVRYMLGVNVSF